MGTWPPGEEPRDEDAGSRDVYAAGRDDTAGQGDALSRQRDKYTQQQEQTVRDRLWAEDVRTTAATQRDEAWNMRQDTRATFEQLLIDREVAASGAALARADLLAFLDDTESDRREAADGERATAGDRRSAAEDTAQSASDRHGPR